MGPFLVRSRLSHPAGEKPAFRSGPFQMDLGVSSIRRKRGEDRRTVNIQLRTSMVSSHVFGKRATKRGEHSIPHLTLKWERSFK